MLSFNPDTTQMVEREIEAFLSHSLENRDEIINMLQDPLNMARITDNVQRQLLVIKEALFNAEKDRLTQAYHQMQIDEDAAVLAEYPFACRQLSEQCLEAQQVLYIYHRDLEVYEADSIALHRFIEEISARLAKEDVHHHGHPSVQDGQSQALRVLEEKKQQYRLVSDLIAEKKEMVRATEREIGELEAKRIDWRREQLAANGRTQRRRRYVGQYSDECLSTPLREKRDSEILAVQAVLDAKLNEYCRALDIRVSFEFIRACRNHFSGHNDFERAEFSRLIDKSEQYLYAYLQLQNQDLKIASLKKNLQIAHDIVFEHQEQERLTTLAKDYLHKAKQFGLAGLIAAGTGVLACGAWLSLFSLLPPMVMALPILTIAAGLWLVAVYDGIQSCLKQRHATAAAVDITRLESEQDRSLPLDGPAIEDLLSYEQEQRVQKSGEVESKRLALREGILTPSLIFWQPHPSAPPLNEWPTDVPVRV